MTSKYAPDGVALAGSPLARLRDALPRDGDSSDVHVYAGDLSDVLASTGGVLPPGLSDKAAGDKHRINAAELRAVCECALRPEPPVENPVDVPEKPEVLQESAPEPVVAPIPTLKEQVRTGTVGADSRRSKK